MRLIDLFAGAIAHPANELIPEKIPWDDPDFSRRMLAEHLSQDHDLASRRQNIIDSHVDWIHNTFLGGKKGVVLDICCGPGFYTERLAKLGHRCTGIDFSPASIDYAKDHSAFPESCRYIHGDIRAADFGSGFDVVLMIFGEFNTFSPTDAAAVLGKMHKSLNPGGQILIEANPYHTIKKIGDGAPTWFRSESGLFSDNPHFCLMEYRWDGDQRRSETDFIVVDAASAEVVRHRSVAYAHSNEDFISMLTKAGFKEAKILPAWEKESLEATDIFLLLRARK